MNQTRLTIVIAVKGLIGLLAWLLMIFAGVELSIEAALGLAGALELVLLALLPEDVYQRIGRRLTNGSPPAVLILLLCSSMLTSPAAEASEARIPLTCTSTATILETSGEVTEEACIDPTAWLDVVVGLHVLALQLTGERQVVELGAAPSLGILFAWRPKFWRATPLLLGVELVVSMTVIDGDGELEHVEAWTVLSLNLLGWMAVGVGGRYGVATRDDLEDFAHLVMTAGLRLPI